MAAFEYTDAAFTTCAPFLKFSKPTLLLPLLPCGALGIVARNRNPLDPHLVSLGFVRCGEESGIGRHALRSMPELFEVLFQTSFHQSRVGRPLLAHSVVRDDLV